jgi:hypothetical protein
MHSATRYAGVRSSNILLLRRLRVTMDRRITGLTSFCEG